MYIRLLVSVVLIGLGVASPWLVRDWLHWQHQPLSAGNSSGRIGGTGGRSASRNVPEVSLSPSRIEPYQINESTGLSRQPNPVTSQTLRMIQGFVPSSLSKTSAARTSFFAGSSELSGMLEKTKKSLEPSLKRLGLSFGSPIFVRVFKEENELELWLRGGAHNEYTLFRIYKIQGWSGRPGPKLREGDGQTPEGFYYVSTSQMRPHTRHHLGFDLGFPNQYDQYHGRNGSEIMIHGKGASIGSFILSDQNMEELYTLADAALSRGQNFFRVNVFPFRMTDKRMDGEWKSQPRWIDFWANLKEGYDFFENAGFPPDVNVSGGKYVFAVE